MFRRKRKKALEARSCRLVRMDLAFRLRRSFRQVPPRQSDQSAPAAQLVQLGRLLHLFLQFQLRPLDLLHPPRLLIQLGLVRQLLRLHRLARQYRSLRLLPLRQSIRLDLEDLRLLSRPSFLLLLLARGAPNCRGCL